MNTLRFAHSVRNLAVCTVWCAEFINFGWWYIWSPLAQYPGVQVRSVISVNCFSSLAGASRRLLFKLKLLQSYFSKQSCSAKHWATYGWTPKNGPLFRANNLVRRWSLASAEFGGKKENTQSSYFRCKKRAYSLVTFTGVPSKGRTPKENPPIQSLSPQAWRIGFCNRILHRSNF